MKPYRPADADTDLMDAVAAGDLAAARLAAEAADRLDRGPGPSLGGVALWYAEQGIPVLALQPGTKVPYPRSHGVSDASTDPRRVGSWWAQHPDANIGLATGHLFDVIDVDGEAGNATLARRLLHPELSHDVLDGERLLPAEVMEHMLAQPYCGLDGLLGVVSTPRAGGRHLYVQPRYLANGEHRPNGAAMRGIDYRGLGGYVVAPPSWLDGAAGASLGLYVWVRQLVLP